MSHTTTEPRRGDVAGREDPHAKTRASNWLLVALALGQLMLVLDVTVANVALPDITRDLQLAGGSTPWVITTYALLLGGFMLVGGRAADVFGPRRVLLAGLATFTAASLFASFSWDAPSLLAARGAQGLGAAFLSPAALAAVTAAFTGDARQRALGVWAAVGGAGASAGVLLGGLLTSGPGWRWIFLVNVPVGLGVLAAVIRLLPATPSRRSSSLDVIGGVTVTAATGSVIFALTRIGQDGSLTPTALLALVAAVLLMGVFAARERWSARPLIDPALFAKPQVVTGAAVMLAASALLVGAFFLLSFYFQQYLGWSALSTGLAFLPMAVGTVAGAHLAARAIPNHGPRGVGPVAFSVAAAGLALAAWQTDNTWMLVSAAGLAAAGLGAGFVTATTTALAHADHTEAGAVSGVVNTFHELGAAVGVAALSGIVTGGVAAQLGSHVVDGLAWSAITAAVFALVGAVVIPKGKPSADAPRFMH